MVIPAVSAQFVSVALYNQQYEDTTAEFKDVLYLRTRKPGGITFAHL